MARETVYDEVFDAQQDFRTIFDAMARPGKINALNSADLTPPEGLNSSATLVAFALLNSDVSYHHAGGNEAVESYLRGNTGVRPAPLEEADFVFGSPSETQALIEHAKEGDPLYPEASATFVVMVDRLAPEPFEGGLNLKLEGPGIDGQKSVCVAGLTSAWLHELKVKNSEFPLGVDIVFAADRSDSRVIACLPRTSRVSV
jgi:alpha-D-ribose 1-methylphosphonate 5-triphosphate synthase subunit PhnH